VDNVLSMTKGRKMMAIQIFSLLYVGAFASFVLFKLNTVCILLEKIHARIEESHKHNLDEKRRSGR
jgi:hypothetical protein